MVPQLMRREMRPVSIYRSISHWNFNGYDGRKIAVHCYSNLDEVEIFVNKKSCDRKVMEKHWYLSWEDIVYEPGVLTAVGYQNGSMIMEKSVGTTEGSYKIELVPYEEEVSSGDMAIVNVRIFDKNGSREPVWGDWTNRFVLVEKADNQAEYSYHFDTDDCVNTAYFTVHGDEMAECWCNGVFAGVIFWNDHCFTVGSFLKNGFNEIRLVLTGNAANIYEHADIYYG